MISAETRFCVEFYDVDSMEVAWHGNYVKYMEVARCALLDKIGYGYKEMKETGFVFPVTNLSLKYIRSLFFGQWYIIKATLVEYENRIKIKFEIRDEKTGDVTTKAESTQMCVNVLDKRTLFECPEIFVKKVEALLKNEE